MHQCKLLAVKLKMTIVVNMKFHMVSNIFHILWMISNVTAQICLKPGAAVLLVASSLSVPALGPKLAGQPYTV